MCLVSLLFVCLFVVCLLFACLLVCLFACLLVCLLACLPACLLARLLACLFVVGGCELPFIFAELSFACPRIQAAPMATDTVEVQIGTVAL